MKKSIPLALSCAVLALGLLPAQAQTTTAKFVADATNGAAPLTVLFTNLSNNATDYSWDFGDGHTSASVDPTNTYTSAGAYTVTLTAIGSGGTNIFSLTNYITVTNALHSTTKSVTNILLNASFSFSAFVQNVTPIQTNVALLTAKQVKVTTKDIINSIATDLGKGTNMLGGAKLLLRVSESPGGPASGFILRQGTNDTDISRYLQFQFPSQYRTVTTERFNPKASTTNSIDYTIIQFFLNTTLGSFNVQGVLKLNSSSLVDKHQVLSSRPVPVSLRAELSGSGLAAHVPTVYRGTFTAAGRKVQIQQVTTSGP